MSNSEIREGGGRERRMIEGVVEEGGAIWQQHKCIKL